MIKAIKGAYASGTDYSVGDVVKEDGQYFLMIKDAAAGTHPYNTLYWNPISDPVTIDALDIAEEAQATLAEKFPNDKQLVLASSSSSSTKKFKITVVDNGTVSATEIT